MTKQLQVQVYDYPGRGMTASFTRDGHNRLYRPTQASLNRLSAVVYRRMSWGDQAITHRSLVPNLAYLGWTFSEIK